VSDLALLLGALILLIREKLLGYHNNNNNNTVDWATLERIWTEKSSATSAHRSLLLRNEIHLRNCCHSVTSFSIAD